MIRLSFKACVGLALVFLTGFALGIGIKILYESSTIKPYSWNVIAGPIIVNCYGKDFSEAQMMRAVDYWTVRGEVIGFYEHNPPPSVCEHKWLKGFIILKKSKKLALQDKTLASTRRYTSFNVVHGAVIEFRPGSQNLDLINEHELGHALGYAHVDIPGHIMHPLYSKMGKDFWVP